MFWLLLSVASPKSSTSQVSHALPERGYTRKHQGAQLEQLIPTGQGGTPQPRTSWPGHKLGELAGRGQSWLSDQAEHQAVGGEQLCWAWLVFLGAVHSHSRIRCEVDINICVSFTWLIFHYQDNNRLTSNLPVRTALRSTPNHFLKYMQEWLSIAKACITMPQNIPDYFFNLT